MKFVKSASIFSSPSVLIYFTFIYTLTGEVYCSMLIAETASSERRLHMSITSDIIRGHTEAIILAHLLEQDSYGYQINKDIMKKTNNMYELKEATLYSAFRRLEQSGYIRTYWGDETVGARRRYYSITGEGRKAYETYKKDWEDAKNTIDRLLI